MTQNNIIWMVANAASGSHKAEVIDRISARFAEAGRPIARHIDCGAQSLPTGAEATAAGVDLVVIHGGDGTITSTVDALAGWAGQILVLPGGTMNLLARALHGDRTPEDIVDRALTGAAKAVRIPVITGEGYCALAGVIAGPTTAWGDVREHVRRLDVKALATSVGDALTQTLSGDDIHVEGHEGEYQAIYLQPSEQGMTVRGVLARNAGELIRHGWAWLSGDFREGPSEDLGCKEAVTLHGVGSVGLLVDGERARAGHIVHFRQEESEHHFLSCLGGAQWS
ncbi:diacylglycerol kinase family protein [soil metagenome]